MSALEKDLAEARRELVESRRIWHEKRDELTQLVEHLTGHNGNLQRLVESAKAVGCVVYFDGHQRFGNRALELLRRARAELDPSRRTSLCADIDGFVRGLA